MTLTPHGLDELLHLARNAALAAGDLALQRRRSGVEVAATKSTPIDIVTQADRDAERLIRSLIAEARPDDGFLGEESGSGAGTSGLTWVVDPIDGTVNYLYGLPAWSVSVAVVEGDPDPLTWRALAGCVVNPTIEEVFTATAGGGAWLGEGVVRVNEGVALDRALIGTGFAYRLPDREPQIVVAAELLRRARDLRRIGSAALDLCNVACGRYDAFYEWGLNPWDHAAGALIAQEAGAAVLGRNGAPGGQDLMVVAAPALAQELVAIVSAARS